MTNISPESPEERHKRLVHDEALGRPRGLRKGSRAREVIKRVMVGVWSEGFIHAGNLAYLSLLTLFPFFIVAAAVAHLFGRTEVGMQTVVALLQTMPPDVAALLTKPIGDVLAARSGSLLWLGAIVGLWTAGSFIETIRDIIRRAYGVDFTRPFWEYRLGSMGIIIGAVVIAMMAFAASVILSGLQQLLGITALVAAIPGGERLVNTIIVLRVLPALMLFGSLYLIFVSLTPRRYRSFKCRKWPGPALVTVWWIATTALLPGMLVSLGGYDLTYGSLAGVMIALIFFFIIGLGLVIGAHLNAALAETPEPTLEEVKQAKVEEGVE
jgi:membrane protein